MYAWAETCSFACVSQSKWSSERTSNIRLWVVENTKAVKPKEGLLEWCVKALFDVDTEAGFVSGGLRRLLTVHVLTDLFVVSVQARCPSALSGVCCDISDPVKLISHLYSALCNLLLHASQTSSRQTRCFVFYSYSLILSHDIKSQF